MPAMTMTYQVAESKQIESLQPGDKISADLVVSKNKGRLERLCWSARETEDGSRHFAGDQFVGPSSVMRVVQETENLFRLTRFGMINCFLGGLETPPPLVDTGLRGSAGAILQAATRLGVSIRRIVLTHAHIDHIGSLDRLMTALPFAEIAIGKREARLLAKDLSLDEGESGRTLFGFTGAKTLPSRLLEEDDHVSSLRAVSSPGHTPGHMAYLDVRDNTLIAGDAFTTQTGVVVAGVFKPLFPFPAIFRGTQCCRRKARQNCAGSIRAFLPWDMAHRSSPTQEIDLALEAAFRRHPEARQQAESKKLHGFRGAG
jgi:glyoxylase-like metal-dependent hydrolase (beta-lactamase superfamily II)